ncbi:hypothetical protein [Arthrobacter sp. Z1-15]
MNIRRTYLWMALLLLALGLGLGSLYLLLDLSGFFGGMCSGAAVMLMILAAYVFGRYIWWERGKDRTDGTEWLPSRDRNDWLPSRKREGRS